MLNFLKRKTAHLKTQKAADNEAKGLYLVQDGTSVLDFPVYAERLPLLKQQISVTDSDYQTQYLLPLSFFAEYVQRLPHPVHAAYRHSGGFLEYTLDVLAASLKFRRGYMLPPGSDTETCYREEKWWTYGIFLAALLQDCWQIPAYFQISLYQGDRFIRVWDALSGKTMPADSALSYRFKIDTDNERVAQLHSSNALIVKSLLPVEKTTQLYQFPAVFNAWFSHVNHQGNTNNPIASIIQQAETALQKTNHPAFAMPVTSDDSSSDKQLMEMKPDLQDGTHSAAIVVQTNSAIPLQEEPHAASKGNDYKKNIKKEFILWLQNAVNQHELSINQKDSLIHHIPEGLFIQIPNTIHVFIKAAPKISFETLGDADAVLQTIIDKILHPNDSRWLMQNKKKPICLHEYFRGRWSDQDFIEGLILKQAGDILNGRQLTDFSQGIHKSPL